MQKIIKSNKQKSFFIFVLIHTLYVISGYVLGSLFYFISFIPTRHGYRYMQHYHRVFDIHNMLLVGTIVAIIFLIVSLIAVFWIKSKGEKYILDFNFAKLIPEKKYPALYFIVEKMSINAGLKHKPELYIVENELPNSYSIGQSHEKAKIIITTGVLEQLSREEIQAVIAHEIAHIKNYDSMVLTRIFILFSILSKANDLCKTNNRDLPEAPRHFFGRDFSLYYNSDSNFSIFNIPKQLAFLPCNNFRPIILKILYSMVSKEREYLADAYAAQFTRSPEALASALTKIKKINNSFMADDTPTSSALNLVFSTSRTASLLTPLYIYSDVDEYTQNKNKLTHPPMKNRIKVLEKMKGSGLADYQAAFKSINRKKIINEKNLTKQPLEKMQEEKNFLEEKLFNSIHIKTKKASKNNTQSKKSLVSNMFADIHDYVIIECDCDTTLKIPSFYVGQNISCPHCNKSHLIKQKEADNAVS